MEQSVDEQRTHPFSRSYFHRSGLLRCRLDRNHDIAEGKRRAVFLALDSRKSRCCVILDLRKRQHVCRLVLAPEIAIQLMNSCIIRDSYRELGRFQAEGGEEILRVAPESSDEGAAVFVIAAEVDAHARSSILFAGFRLAD